MSEHFDLMTEEESAQRFKEILAEYPSWQPLVDSQGVEGLSRFVGFALRTGLARTERAHQEGNLASALNRSSILAKSQDRQYLPRKRVASTGRALFKNPEAVSVSLPAGMILVSEAQRPYALVESVVVPGNGEIMAALSQHEALTRDVVISESKPFLELLLPQEESARVCALAVSVNEGAGFQAWRLAPRFRNVGGTDAAYDEFYTFADQLAVRFGNGHFGRMPALGATVRLRYEVTDGPVDLLPGQPLKLVAVGALPVGVEALEISAATAITGGASGEPIEEIRRNAQYYPLYDESLVWSNDYAFFIRRRFPQVLWLKVWGEAEQEQESGFDVNNINRIFVAAHAPALVDAQAKILGVLQGVALLNRKFTWKPPVHRSFTVAYTASVPRQYDLERVKADVKAVLERHYGRDSAERRETALLKDLYRLIDKTGYFEAGGQFEIALSGTTAPAALDQMVSLDLAASTFTVGYAV